MKETRSVMNIGKATDILNQNGFEPDLPYLPRNTKGAVHFFYKAQQFLEENYTFIYLDREVEKHNFLPSAHIGSSDEFRKFIDDWKHHFPQVIPGEEMSFGEMSDAIHTKGNAFLKKIEEHVTSRLDINLNGGPDPVGYLKGLASERALERHLRRGVDPSKRIFADKEKELLAAADVIGKYLLAGKCKFSSAFQTVIDQQKQPSLAR